MAPEWLGSEKVAETPAMDAKLVKGRVIEIPVSELTGDQGKYYMRIGLKAMEPKEGSVSTKFHSFFCVNEYIMRVGRKGLGKVSFFGDVVTKDNWKIQVSAIAVLNRRGNANIKTEVRKFIGDLITSKAGDLNHDEFVKSAMAGVFQMKIKKGASKLYPVRFSEIIKIETIKAGG